MWFHCFHKKKSWVLLKTKPLKTTQYKNNLKIHPDASNSIIIIPDWYLGTKLLENFYFWQVQANKSSVLVFDKKA